MIKVSKLLEIKQNEEWRNIRKVFRNLYSKVKDYVMKVSKFKE